jgi:malate dehydrogenase (oxaloacetate-decarboxylating)
MPATVKIPEIILVQTRRRPGSLAKVLGVIADHGLVIEGLEALHREQDRTTWEITLEFDDGEIKPVAEDIEALPDTRVLGRSDRVFQRHLGGKIRVEPRVPIATRSDLRDLYTPGVARVCLAIQEEPEAARRYTNLPNTVAVVTNGTAILGLGDIGPVAGLPVMEGKAALFAQLAGISGVPILIAETDPTILTDAIAHVAPSFGAIQLEDIRAPECFEVEERLRERLDIPVLHDDQHGTAVVVLAALLTATREVGVDLKGSTVGQLGLGAAGIGIARLLLHYGVGGVVGADLNPGARERLESMGGETAELEEVMARADVVVMTTGVRGLVKPELVREGQVILSLSNPDPEIEPELALEAGAAFAADGKSINNVLAFPGLFRGALDAGARVFSDRMLVAAAKTISEAARGEELVPDALNPAVHLEVAAAVQEAARADLAEA